MLLHTCRESIIALKPDSWEKVYDDPGFVTVVAVSYRLPGRPEPVTVKIAIKHTPNDRLRCGGIRQVLAEEEAASALSGGSGSPSPLLVLTAGSGTTRDGGVISIYRYAGINLRRLLHSSWWQAKTLKQREPLVAHMLACVATALLPVHAAGFVHRDIRLENLICDPDTGLVQLADFGLATKVDGTNFFAAYTKGE